MRACTRQPQGAVQCELPISWAANINGLLVANNQPVNLRGFFSTKIRFGELVTEINTGINSKTLDIGLTSGAAYSILMRFAVLDSAITNTSGVVGVCTNAIDTMFPAGGSYIGTGTFTSMITGEVFGISNGSNSNRTASTESIPVGMHTAVFHWIGDRYQILIDGKEPNTIHNGTNYAELITPKLYLATTHSSGAPNIAWSLFALCKNNSVDLRQYATNPWSLFAEPQWLYTGMGSGSWTPLEVTG